MTKHYDPAAVAALVEAVDNAQRRSLIWPLQPECTSIPNAAMKRIDDAMRALQPTEPAPASAGLSDGVRAALIDLREKNQRLPFDAVDDELGRIIAMLDYQPAASAGLLAAAELVWQTIPAEHDGPQAQTHARALTHLRDAIAAEKARKPMPEEHNSALSTQLDYYKSDLDRIRSAVDPDDDSDEKTADLVVSTIADLRERLAKAEDQRQADLIDHGRREADLLSRVKEQGDRAEKAESQMHGVMHFVDKWFDDGRSMPDDPAQRANEAREIALQAIEKAEANSGAAVLRRLLDSLWQLELVPPDEGEFPSDDCRIRSEAIGDFRKLIDRLLAEIEKPAAEEPQEREGDDVLREWVDRYDDAAKRGFEWEEDDDALAELCRRALGGGA